MLRMNESASIWNSSTSPSRRHCASQDVAGEAPVVGLGRREGGEVVLAAEGLARRRASASSSTRCGHHSARPRSNGRRLAASQHAVDGSVRLTASWRAEKPSGASSARQHDDLAREHRVDRAQVGQRAGVGDDLAERVDAAVGAAGDGQLDRLAQDGGRAP